MLQLLSPLERHTHLYCIMSLYLYIYIQIDILQKQKGLVFIFKFEAICIHLLIKTYSCCPPLSVLIGNTYF